MGHCGVSAVNNPDTYMVFLITYAVQRSASNIDFRQFLSLKSLQFSSVPGEGESHSGTVFCLVTRLSLHAW